jgi:hypothetical protein
MNKIIPINSSNLSDKFIELDRTFHEVSKDSSENDDLEISWAFRFGDRLHWADLIKEYRLIILSEAGSGKTAEIRNVANMIRNQGKSAFFLRLEYISENFEVAFEVGTFNAFEEWLGSGEEGWLFLDSVDEARLHKPSDFELAILKLGKRISTAKDRTHIVITSRTTAWRPRTDLARCTESLPYTVATRSEGDPQAEDDCPEGSLPIKTTAQDSDKQVFKIVTLDDLTSSQITMFAENRGILDSQRFLDAVKRADAWSFTSRPQDLLELTEFWIDTRRIGTRLELMKSSIDRRLTERDQNRAEVHPLTPECTRQGARLLAAATTLAKSQQIRVPDGAENSQGVAIKDVLPDWDANEQSTLLLRPIFDEAIYGTVRFHHRSVREYLAAEWFAELLKRETSRRGIEALFFRNQYGLDIIVPTLRPILPWLAILDEKILKHVLQVAPEIILEGGDPSQLPLEVRRDILRKVCIQIVDGVTSRSIPGYSAVQRFTNSDLTNDVCELLRQHADNEYLATFLLEMIWLGQLAGALPAVMNIALMPTAKQDARVAAFRAIKVIGRNEDQERVRQSFLSESSKLKSEWLATILEDTQPTEENVVWLLACLEKSEQQKPYTSDHLADNVTKFVVAADIELLPQLLTGLHGLLSLPPMIDNPDCEVSEKFLWLMAPLRKAIERLISAYHPMSIEPNVLTILHKFSVTRDYGIKNLGRNKDEFFKLIPAWRELNRAFFWFQVQERRREFIEQKYGYPLIYLFQVSLYEPYWKFEESDFSYVAQEIAHQELFDDKLVALSLAFELYKSANRPHQWCLQLKKLVASDTKLSMALTSYLKPPAQSQESRQWKQQAAKREKQRKATQEKKEKYHKDWKNYFENNLEKERAKLQDQPGIITNSLFYLFEQTRSKKSNPGRWTEYNWKTLIPDYGEEVARFYRDSIVSYWRHYEPKLRSEGAPANQTLYAIIVGLIGIEIESIEIQDWRKNLSVAEVNRACKYASFELNGFPLWFPRLFETYPEIVSKFLIQEIRYELSIEKPDTEIHYILSKVSWSGQWAWDEIAPNIYEILKKEPKNLSNLEKLLKILQDSTLSDDLIEKLASRKCRTLKDTNHLAQWFATWVGVAPESAILSFKEKIKKIVGPDQQTLFVMIFITHLRDNGRGRGSNARLAFKKPEYLKSLYLLMHKYIRQREDVNRAGMGVYSPGLRDDAQDARDSLLNLLTEIPGKESFVALNEIAKMHPEEKSRPWISLNATTRAEQDGDIEPWSPAQVQDFHNSLERTPRNHSELAELAILRLLDLKDDLENGDDSIAVTLKRVTKETEIRNFIGNILRDKAQGRYSIPQEEELADAKRPDLRFHGVGFDGPVPVELKLADNNWSGSKLFERLENQLCGDYLRDNRSSRGIFLLVYRGKKAHWEVPGDSEKVDFSGLITALKNHWQGISPNFANVEDITVIGIDLTKRLS